MENKKDSSYRSSPFKNSLFVGLLVVLFLYVIPWVNVLLFTDPLFGRFDGYHRLYNWDLKQHANDDYDGDGQQDVITFWGCAFLSATDISTIPDSKKCISPSYAPLGNKNMVGQKFILTDDYNLSESFQERRVAHHSYLGKYENQPWSLYVRQDKIRRFEITAQGLLEEKPVSFANRLDEFVYWISNISILPLIIIPYSFFIGTGLLVIFTIAFLIYFVINKKKK